MAIYKRNRGFQLGTTENKSSKFLEEDSNPEPPDCESDALPPMSSIDENLRAPKAGRKKTRASRRFGIRSGSLRFITSYSRLALVSVRKTKRLRSRKQLCVYIKETPK